MRFLNFLPFAAVLVAAAPAVQPPTKDLVKRDANPCSSENGGDHTEGCYNPPDKYDYTKYDVAGVIVYNVKFEGTLEYYEVSFDTYNPNTKWHTPCKTGVQNTKDFQLCERVRTAFIINIDDNEITTRESVTVYLKLVWEYSECALPRALSKAKGKDFKDDECHGVYYYQIGELTFQATCTKDTKTSTIDGGSTTEDDGLTCDTDGYCVAPEKVPDHKGGGGVVKKETHVKCYFQGELTVVTVILKPGQWDGKNDDDS